MKRCYEFSSYIYLILLCETGEKFESFRFVFTHRKSNCVPLELLAI
jgi:hypothetical protein